VTTSTDIHIENTLTVGETASSLGVSERTVWRYLKSGRLQGETVGPIGSQRTLVAADSVEALRAERGGADVEALRAERDRLVSELTAMQAERDALAARVHNLQSAATRRRSPVSGLVDRVAATVSRVGLPSA
jgi:hypothetical protein